MTAALIFDDPYAMTIRDVLRDEDEERTSPLANLAQAEFSLVVHTWFADGKGRRSDSVDLGPCRNQ
jgi:hypothetical protein